MKIYAIRHGQTDLNAEGRVQGKGSDLPLNDEGKRKAKEIAKSLKGLGIDLIVSSPMNRAIETATIIANQIGYDPNSIIRGMRLCERDFGDYEGKPMAEVDINALRRWTDNAPTPNGETIRDVASRVFDFMDAALVNFSEKIEHERRDVLYKKHEEPHDWNKPYDRDESHRAIEKAFRLVDEDMKQMPEIKILFVVHGYVLRTMYWYFNGLPEDGNETTIETDNCGIYEFDTEKIPPRMNEYQIVLDRKMLEDRLKRLSKSPYKASYSTCFAMCYVPGGYEVTFEDYKCPTCGKESKHKSKYIHDLNHAKEAVDTITKGRLKVDAVIDEREFCRYCGGKASKHPEPILKIRFSPDEQYHEERTADYYDYKCLTSFIKCLNEYEGRSSSSSMSDMHHPLVDKVDQIVRMTGLCPEIVNDWKAWVDECTKADKAAAESAEQKHTAGGEADGDDEITDMFGDVTTKEELEAMAAEVYGRAVTLQEINEIAIKEALPEDISDDILNNALESALTERLLTNSEKDVIVDRALDAISKAERYEDAEDADDEES